MKPIRIRRSWAKLTSPPHPVPRSASSTSASAARIHAFVRRQILLAHAGPRRALLWLRWAVWTLTAPLHALWNACASGPAIRRRTGRPLWRQAAEQLTLAWRDAIPPKTYYRFRLYLPEPRARAGDYLQRFETKGALYRFLSPDCPRAQLLQDKLAFSAECRRAGLPSAPVWMEFRDGRALPVDADSLPTRDLIVKARRGKGGRSLTRWCHRDDGRYESNDGRVLERDALMRHLAELSLRRPYLVQPRLVNHPALADLSRDVLMTVRVVTCSDQRGGGEVTNASFRLGRAHAVVDNMHRGGIAAAVDVTSGRLGPAISLEGSADWLVKHPETGAVIAGRVLPGWPEAVALACRAHRVFAPLAIIGWDVALLEDGPCLIEGNRAPCVNLIQVPLGGPLGSGRFGELVAQRIARIEAGERTAS
jgi:hypothetical protein